MKTAVITGASSDMARALTQQLQDAGWTVKGILRDAVDLSDLAAVRLYANTLAENLESVDAFAHFAGVWHDANKALAGVRLEQFSAEEVAGSMNVGVTSFMVLLTKLLPKFATGGAVIGISRTFADGATGWVPYYVSKRAQEDFLVGLSQDYADKLRVYGISPSDTATEPYKHFYPRYAATGQAPEAVTSLAFDLITGKTSYASGDVIELKHAEQRKGFHV